MNVAVTEGSHWRCNENGLVYAVLPFASVGDDGKLFYDRSNVVAHRINVRTVIQDSFSWMSSYDDFVKAFTPVAPAAKGENAS